MRLVTLRWPESNPSGHSWLLFHSEAPAPRAHLLTRRVRLRHARKRGVACAAILDTEPKMGPLEATRLRFSSSLRGKTLLIIGLTMFGLVGGLYVLSRVLLLRGFSHLEEDFARQNLERISSALANELGTLDRTTSEYASWDQSYAYLHGKQPSYARTEFPDATFQQLKINFVVILDNSGKKVFSKGFNL